MNENRRFFVFLIDLTYKKINLFRFSIYCLIEEFHFVLITDRIRNKTNTRIGLRLLRLELLGNINYEKKKTKTNRMTECHGVTV